MGISPAQQGRLAREARKLAFECAEGKATVGYGSVFADPPCAIAIITGRAGCREPYPAVDGPAYYAMWRVIEATDNGPACERLLRVVFPLLDLADELDAASEQPAAEPPSSAIPDKEKGQ